ncbi:type VII secretion-associated serine protease mycosin [Micromonospora sp. WMMD987]|uniref:type VII secretion-associated serine protease mycosin n=1 Tax=Micromonospora sp. WMMD987 TaxID=3016089 RepID=UPI002499BE90|nr:type VII secretion-associated serine protease mycosin [Micromonospora sp. WMMD987]WFE96326.1 type VII secretion-associated serine protease mycosin [Micromonospora sp. WMMD987]
MTIISTNQFGNDIRTSDVTKQVRKDQWHLQYLKVDKAHDISKGAGVLVAVPDTGVDKHPDLLNNLTQGVDLSTDGSSDDTKDRDSHGTGMAGLICAHGQANKGALGIAPQSKVLPIRIKLTNNQGNSGDLTAGINYAISKKASVISVSMTGDSDVQLQRAVRDAVRADIVVVAGAGNQPSQHTVGYPAAYPGVLAVGGIGPDGKHASVSVTGPEIDVVAPAVDIYSTSIDGKYRKGTGTSDATAIVAGAAALVRSKYPYLPAAEVVHRLTATAVDKGPPGRDDEYGYGVIDLVAALTADVPPLGFESATAAPPSGGATSASAQPAGGDGDRGAAARGWATLGVIVAAGCGFLVWRRRRRADDPPPRISR